MSTVNGAQKSSKSAKRVGHVDRHDQHVRQAGVRPGDGETIRRREREPATLVELGRRRVQRHGRVPEPADQLHPPRVVPQVRGDHAAGTHDTDGLGERRSHVGHEVEDEARHDGVGRPVIDRQRIGPPDRERRHRVRDALARRRHEVGRRIHADQPARAASARRSGPRARRCRSRRRPSSPRRGRSARRRTNPRRAGSSGRRSARRRRRPASGQAPSAGRPTGARRAP